MLNFMLDSNIVIYTMKNRPRQVRSRFKMHEGKMCISSVTLGELVFGAVHSQHDDCRARPGVRIDAGNK